MREVSVIGVGMFPLLNTGKKRWLKSAGRRLRQQSRMQASTRRISRPPIAGRRWGMMSGQRVRQQLGITGLPITNVKCCSSSSQRSVGLYRGCGRCIRRRAGPWRRKLTKFGGGTLPLEKEDFEVTHGLVMPALYGMRAAATCTTTV